MSVPIPSDAPVGASLHADVAQSLRNAVKLGSSLLATWAVAVVVRVLLPRALGPADFGVYQFAEAFTITLFVITGLGVETYVRKEVAGRPQHASEFFAGTLLLALGLGVAVTLLALLGLRAAGKPDEVLRLVIVLGGVQFLVNANSTVAAVLHAVGRVGGLSVLNVVTKLAWGGGIGIALAAGSGVHGVAVAALAAEALRASGLAFLARRHAGLQLAIDMRASLAVLATSLPYYLHSLAHTVYARLDMSVLSFLSNDLEVGWYGASQALAGVSMLMAPLIGWILLPLTSRAAARSAEELFVVARRALQFILSAALPITLLLWIGADVLVATIFGAEFAPAARSLRILAPMFVLTYMAMVGASVLVRLDRGWAVTWISVSGMVLSAVLNLTLVPRFLPAFGAGGAGMGSAVALVVTECYVVAIMLWLLGRRAVDRRLLAALGKSVAVCAAVAAADLALQPLGAWRLVVDGTLYLALASLVGAIDLRAIAALARRPHADRPPAVEEAA